MGTTTPRMLFPEIAASQAQKEVTHNEALKMLDVFVFMAVEDKDLTTPPGGESEGESWIVATGGAGAWAGHDLDIAQYYNAGWTFYDALEGYQAWVKDEDAEYVFDGAAWVPKNPVDVVQALTPGDIVGVNWSVGSTATVLLDRALTTFAFSGGKDGQRCVLVCTQDGTGGRTIAFGAEVRGGTDLTIPPALTAAINKEDYLGFIYRTSTTKYDFVSISKGY